MALDGSVNTYEAGVTAVGVPAEKHKGVLVTVHLLENFQRYIILIEVKCSMKRMFIHSCSYRNSLHALLTFYLGYLYTEGIIHVLIALLSL